MAPLFDWLIRSDRILTTHGLVAGQVAIVGGRIAAILGPGESAAARQQFDASGLAILPGAVDIHTHLRDPGHTHKEDFATGTAAAAAGGWTTVIAQPNTDPPLTTRTAFLEAVAIGRRRSLVDFGVAAMATSQNGGAGGELAAMCEAGAMLIEAALADLPTPLLVENLGQLAAILETGVAAKRLVAVYANDQSLVVAATGRLRTACRVDPLAPGEGRPGCAEAAAIAAVAELAAALGARIHLRQLSTRQAVAAVGRARSIGGADLTAEVNPHHLFLTSEAAPALGPLSRVIPPLRAPADQAELWQALRSGLIDLISTDHAPHTEAEKEQGRHEIWQAASGLPVLETALPLLLDRVAAGEVSLAQVARWTAEQPARRVGLYPRKGAIAVGADADLLLAEIGKPWQVDPSRFQSKARWSPFAGQVLQGRVAATMVRGEWVYQNGQTCREAGGQFLRPAPGK